MLKVVAACGAGMGTSMIIKLKLEKIFKDLNVDAKVDAMSVGQAKGTIGSCDLIICSLHLKDQFNANEKTKVVGVKNLMDEKELTEAIKGSI